MNKSFATIPSKEKAAIIVNWLEEHKAKDAVTIEVKELCSFTDIIIVVTASSLRHGQSLADGINELCGKEKFEFLHLEGYQTGDWILVDLNDIIVNIFQDQTRDLYRLESLWADSQQY